MLHTYKHTRTHASRITHTHTNTHTHTHFLFPPLQSTAVLVRAPTPPDSVGWHGSDDEAAECTAATGNKIGRGKGPPAYRLPPQQVRTLSPGSRRRRKGQVEGPRPQRSREGRWGWIDGPWAGSTIQRKHRSDRRRLAALETDVSATVSQLPMTHATSKQEEVGAQWGR